MRRLALLSLLLPIAALNAQSSATRRAIASVNARYLAILNKGDIAQFAEVYSPDATMMTPNAPTLVGRAAIRDFWQGGWNSGLRNLRLTTLELYDQGNEATEVGRYELDAQSADGAKAGSDRGKYIVIWKRDAHGQWKWYRDIYNSDLPATPPAQADTASSGGAMSGDSVFIILLTVKPEQRAGLDEFERTFRDAGTKSTDPVIRRLFARTRALVPLRSDADGNFTYAYLMDPVIRDADYLVPSLSRRLFPAAEAERVTNLFSASHVGDGKVLVLRDRASGAVP